jgi:hypothetical protein
MTVQDRLPVGELLLLKKTALENELVITLESLWSLTLANGMGVMMVVWEKAYEIAGYRQGRRFQYRSY